MPNALIIGASRGIGRGLTQEFLARGWDVTSTVRDPATLADIATDALTVETLEVTDWAGIDALGARLPDGGFDLLFVVAGIMGPSEGPIGEADPDAFAELLRVNTIAPLRIADRWAAKVAADGTVAVMTSSLGSIGLNTGAGYEAYRTSKAALNMGLKSLAMRRAGGRTWLAVDPGWVRTDMGGEGATLSVEQSASGIADTIAARAGKGGVAFVDYRNEEHPW